MIADTETYRWATRTKSWTVDRPSSWLTATAWIVGLFLALQLISGVLLGFYYVPSVDSAHTTIAYVEKVVGAGSCVRSLHYHCSQWLPLALVLHLTQLLRRQGYVRHPVMWIGSLALLCVALMAGSTGYILPWDARAVNAANIGSGLVGGLPLIGNAARRWVLNGSEITTLTLSRFYALHVFATPVLLMLCFALRLLVQREGRWPEFTTLQWRRNVVVASVVCAATLLIAAKYPAPFGPPASEAFEYLPRPGPQFLWLFESLKYLPDKIASLVAMVFPALFLLTLAVIPWLLRRKMTSEADETTARGSVVFLLFIGGFGMVASLTSIAYLQDARDPQVRQKLVQQASAEAAFRSAPFSPSKLVLSKDQLEHSSAATSKEAAQNDHKESISTEPPSVYLQQCAKCHGRNGEGVPGFDGLVGVTTREEEKRTVADLVAIINDPRAFGLGPKMRSFATQLSESEKQNIANWIATLK